MDHSSGSVPSLSPWTHWTVDWSTPYEGCGFNLYVIATQSRGGSMPQSNANVMACAGTHVSCLNSSRTSRPARKRVHRPRKLTAFVSTRRQQCASPEAHKWQFLKLFSSNSNNQHMRANSTSARDHSDAHLGGLLAHTNWRKKQFELESHRICGM